MASLEETYGIEKAEEIREECDEFLNVLRMYYGGDITVNQIAFDLTLPDGVNIIILSGDVTRPYRQWI